MVALLSAGPQWLASDNSWALACGRGGLRLRVFNVAQWSAVLVNRFGRHPISSDVREPAARSSVVSPSTLVNA